MNALGWRCAVCGAERGIADASPWRCPNATPDDHRHVLHLVSGESARSPADRTPQAQSPFVTYDERFAWAAYAAAHGVSLAARRSLVEELDDAVAEVGVGVGVEVEVEGASAGRGDGSTGVGFRSTPLGRSDELSAALGFGATGGVWVKDDSVNVAGSHKARHLFSILLHLRASELVGHLPTRSPLAIASCGNAALAAAVLARAALWPIDVYVPEWMSAATGRQLSALGATVHRCARRDGDPAGDPAMLRFREAVQGGAIPFTVQGPENALCLDGGRTIGWEIADQLTGSAISHVDQIYAQIGGGAFATCLGRGLREAGSTPRLHAVQAEGCAPLARAWERASGDVDGLDLGDAALGRRWPTLMTTWDDPQSLADGILDDETYDWLGVFDAMRASGGTPVIAAESDIAEAHRLANDAGFDVSATGSAGLAGLLVNRAAVAADDRVIVVFTGVER